MIRNGWGQQFNRHLTIPFSPFLKILQEDIIEKSCYNSWTKKTKIGLLNWIVWDYYWRPLLLMLIAHVSQGGRGHLTVYYTSPQSFIITFPNSRISQLQNFGGFYWILISRLLKLRVQTFKTNNCNLHLYNHWGCTSIYRPLSYPFKSMECLYATGLQLKAKTLYF